ncbi:MAG: T9SS type A sorting domain-containing protein, partial [Bacteroidota bacterium]
VQATVATLAEEAQIRTAATWWTDTDFTTSTTEVDQCQFDLSPNPASGFINIKWDNNCLFKDVNIKLMDINGRIVRKTENINQSVQSHQMEINNLEKGIYFIQLKSGNRKWTEKVVVN